MATTHIEITCPHCRDKIVLQTTINVTAARHAETPASNVGWHAQVKWIEDHGGNETGYVKRYGGDGQGFKYGDGGVAIFKADMGELIRIQDQMIAEGIEIPTVNLNF